MEIIPKLRRIVDIWEERRRVEGSERRQASSLDIVVPLPQPHNEPYIAELGIVVEGVTSSHEPFSRILHSNVFSLVSRTVWQMRRRSTVRIFEASIAHLGYNSQGQLTEVSLRDRNGKSQRANITDSSMRECLTSVNKARINHFVLVGKRLVRLIHVLPSKSSHEMVLR